MANVPSVPPWSDDDYPEGHGPYCHVSCDHPIHERYDEWAAKNGSPANTSAG